MTILQSQFDPNRQIAAEPTSFMTVKNEHEVRCGICAREISIDNETYSLGNKAIESGLDNPFRCEVCAEFDAYEG